MIAEHKLLHSPHTRKVIWIVCQHVGNVAGNVYDYRYGNVKYTAPKQGKYSIALKVLYRLPLCRILGIAEVDILPISPEQRSEKYDRKASPRVYAYPLAGGAKAEEQPGYAKGFQRSLKAVGMEIHAVILYNRVAEYSPDNVLVYYNRARLYAHLGEIRRAVADYTRAIELYPDFANAYLGRSDMRRILRDAAGAKRDREVAERKIAEYRSRLSDSTYSIYGDTTQRFNKLLSFESKIAGSSFEQIKSRHTDNGNMMTLLPMYRYTFRLRDSIDTEQSTRRFHSQRAEDFAAKFKNPLLTISRLESNIEPDSLLRINRAYRDEIKHSEKGGEWLHLFELAISESLIKQYTNSVNTFTAAIEKNPSNPFLYLNRAAVRAEMIDFISSIDNGYQRISIETDPANRLHNSHTRIYDYDEAISDLNKAIKLDAHFAYAYYNRANLYALSGKLPEAFNDYTKAIELNPHFAEAYYNRGLIQIYMKDTRKGYLDVSKAGELGIVEAYELLRRYAKE